MKSFTETDLPGDENLLLRKFLEENASNRGEVHYDLVDDIIELSEKIGGLSVGNYKGFSSDIIMVCDKSSLIVALAGSMSYFLKTGKMYDAAIAAGAKRNLDGWVNYPVNEVFGPDWVVGSYHKDEEIWIRSVIA